MRAHSASTSSNFFGCCHSLLLLLLQKSFNLQDRFLTLYYVEFWEFFGIFGGFFGILWEFWDLLGPFETIWDLLGTFWDLLGPLGPFWSLFGPFKDFFGPFRSLDRYILFSSICIASSMFCCLFHFPLLLEFYWFISKWVIEMTGFDKRHAL